MEGINTLIAQLHYAQQRLGEIEAMTQTSRPLVSNSIESAYRASETLAVITGTSTAQTLLEAYGAIQETNQALGRADVELLSAEIHARRSILAIDEYVGRLRS